MEYFYQSYNSGSRIPLVQTPQINEISELIFRVFLYFLNMSDSEVSLSRIWGHSHAPPIPTQVGTCKLHLGEVTEASSLAPHNTG